MASSWIEHVKAYAKKNNIKYNEALKKAGPSYKKKGASARGSASKTTTLCLLIKRTLLRCT